MKFHATNATYISSFPSLNNVDDDVFVYSEKVIKKKNSPTLLFASLLVVACDK